MNKSRNGVLTYEEIKVKGFMYITSKGNGECAVSQKTTLGDGEVVTSVTEALIVLAGTSVMAVNMARLARLSAWKFLGSTNSCRPASSPLL